MATVRVADGRTRHGRDHGEHAGRPTGREPARRDDVARRYATALVGSRRYTRLYIVDAAAGLPSAEATSKRLLKNQEDIGNAIEPYYGSAAGAKLTDLLKQHILIAVDLVAAAKANDQTKLADADKRWHANAADIASFLSSANPNWPKQTLLSMLNEHLALTTQEATARLQQRWDDDIAAFDKIFSQAMMMADALSNGIAKQFPGKVNTN